MSRTLWFFFVTPVAAIHCKERSVVDLRKIGEYVYLKKYHCSPALLKVAIYSTELIVTILV